MGKNIVLVGFMGTGKTAVGRGLAEEMSMKYVSVDDEIESAEKRTISEIFQAEGEMYFRAIEKDVIKNITRGSGQVIDCGGGAVLEEENLNNLKASGDVFCLWAEPEAILKRVGRSADRPLLNVKDPMAKIEELLEKRRSCYLRADFHIDTTNMGTFEVINKIREIAYGQRKP
jgi:shikimate kinase